MFEPTNALLNRLLSLVIGILILIIILILGIRLISNTSSSSGSTAVAGSSNVITGSVEAVVNGFSATFGTVGDNFEHGIRVTGHVMSVAPRPLILASKWSGHLIGSTSLRSVKFGATIAGQTFRFGGNTVFSVVRFIGYTNVESMVIAGESVLRISSFMATTTNHSITIVSDVATMSPLTKQTTSKPVPVIDPFQEAIDLKTASATQAASPAPVATAASVTSTPPSAATTRPDTGSVTTTSSNPISYTPNDYAWGNCTWWVAIQRADINDPIPNNWGNAATWAVRAEADGYVVNHIPAPGAIMQISDVDYGLGHVAFVESVDPDGTWNISEMNVLGIDIVDHKSEPASAAADYYFIHDN